MKLRRKRHQPPERAEKQDTMTSTTVQDRKAPVTHKDLSLAYLMEGIGKVGEMLKDHSQPVMCLEKSIAFISEKNPDQDVSELSNLRDIFAASQSTGVRGRKAAQIGETRVFKAQQVKTRDAEGNVKLSDVFLRLNLSTFKANKGDAIRVTFNDGNCLVTLASADDIADDELDVDEAVADAE